MEAVFYREALEEGVGFLDYFSKLEDPRCDVNKLYPMNELLLLTLSAVICGAEGWEDVEEFGKSKERFLKQYLAYEHGIPSDDTLRRFFRAVDPESFQRIFMEWVKSFSMDLQGKVIAIDGKTSRHSYENADHAKQALHLISAFATEARIVLGQRKVDGKSNEITALPKLIELLDVRGATVSIDAMGCQKNIAGKIRDKRGDYLLGLKGNQGALYEDIKLFFEDKVAEPELHSYEETDSGHGRIEVRRCSVTENIGWLKEHHDWVGLRSIVKITANRRFKGKEQDTTEETRYYITSLPPDPRHILQAVRSHWRIENALHWVLDMSFNDDYGRIRKENAPHNMAVIRHIALNMMRAVKTKRRSIKGLRKSAGWNEATLSLILTHKL